MITPAEYEQLVRAEYVWLRERFDLDAVPLEFKHTPDSGAPMYGGQPCRIVLPFSDNDLSVVYDKTPTPPTGPPTWEDRSRQGYSYWTIWRSDFWHEVMHQVQEQKGFGFDLQDGTHGHSKGWQPAVEWAASQLGAPPRELYDRLASLETPPYR